MSTIATQSLVQNSKGLIKLLISTSQNRITQFFTSRIVKKEIRIYICPKLLRELCFTFFSVDTYRISSAIFIDTAEQSHVSMAYKKDDTKDKEPKHKKLDTSREKRCYQWTASIKLLISQIWSKLSSTTAMKSLELTYCKDKLNLNSIIRWQGRIWLYNISTVLEIVAVKL